MGHFLGRAYPSRPGLTAMSLMTLRQLRHWMLIRVALARMADAAITMPGILTIFDIISDWNKEKSIGMYIKRALFVTKLAYKDLCDMSRQVGSMYRVCFMLPLSPIIISAFIKSRIPGKTTCSKALRYNKVIRYSSTCHGRPPLVQRKSGPSWQVAPRDRERTLLHYVKSNTHIRQHIFHSTCTTL